jgi:hypothetical protein
MAIEFQKTVNQDNLLFAFNNNIIRFNSTEPDPINAEIIGFGFPIVLYPHPNGSFYFNFKEYSSVLVNNNNFADDLVYVPATFLYDWTNRVYFPTEIEVKINFADDEFETTTIDAKFFSAYTQIDLIDFIETDKFKVLSPSTKFKFWKGYPFDITTFNTTDPENIEIYNIKAETGIQVATDYIVSRILVSDGVSVQSVFDEPGEVQYSLVELERGVPFSIETIQPNCHYDVYLKWINRFGGWNYWLFRRARKPLTTKAIGELNNDFNDVEDTISQSISMGVTSKASLLVKEVVQKDQMPMFTDLAESAKIYLFKGNPNTLSTPQDWIEVTVKDRTIEIQDAKRNFNTINFEIELPTRTTRTV